MTHTRSSPLAVADIACIVHCQMSPMTLTDIQSLPVPGLPILLAVRQPQHICSLDKSLLAPSGDLSLPILFTVPALAFCS